MKLRERDTWPSSAASLYGGGGEWLSPACECGKFSHNKGRSEGDGVSLGSPSHASGVAAKKEKRCGGDIHPAGAVNATMAYWSKLLDQDHSQQGALDLAAIRIPSFCQCLQFSV